MTKVPGEDYYFGSDELCNLAALHGEFRAQWLSLLRTLVAETSSRIGLGSSVAAKLPSWRQAAALPPEFYFRTHQLRVALDIGSVTAAIDAIHFLSRLHVDPCVTETPVIDTILSEAWEREYIDVLRSYRPDRALEVPNLVRPIVSRSLHDDQSAIRKALYLISEVDPTMSGEVHELLRAIKLFDGVVLRGHTDRRTFGAVYIRVPPPAEHLVWYWILHIVHEVSHMTLELLAIHDPLVLNRREEHFSAPIRRDPRPMFGVLHATFVLTRMLRVAKQCYAQLPKELSAARLDESILDLAARQKKGVDVLKRFGRFTKRGLAIVSKLESAAH